MNNPKRPTFVPSTEAEDAAEVAAAYLPPGQTEMGLDEAVKLAVRMHRENRLEGARTLYQRILAAAPGHTDVTSLLGVLQHRLGNTEAGLVLLRQAADSRPDVPGYLVNLGNVLAECNRLDEALQVLRKASGMAPDSPDIHNNVGAIHRASGAFDDALASYQRAIALDPRHVNAWNNCGLLHYARGDLEAATHAYLTAIDIAPDLGITAHRLGMTFYQVGQIAKACEVFRQWKLREPGNPVPAHLYAACSGEGVPERASDRYVEAEFDTFARSFESVLTERLDYQAPRLCSELMATVIGPAARALDVLDAGCGTGLCGPLVAPWARRLVGVDLSAGMLAQARSKGVYDELVKSELSAFMASSNGQWGAIISADTLCYFGDLSAVMRTAAGSLRPGGVMVYTVEALADDSQTGATILPNGRYAHGRAHLDQVAREAGLVSLHARREVLRKEAGAPVHGWLMAVMRPA